MAGYTSSDIVSPEYLSYLKSLYPRSVSTSESRDPWYVVAAAAFGANNSPESVPKVLKFVLAQLPTASHEEKLLVVKRIREALFKGGLISGYSRTITALVSLYEVTPEELRETNLIRDVSQDGLSDFRERGQVLYNKMFGEKQETLALIDKIHPDMGWFALNIACGYTWCANDILSQVETSYVIVAANIAMDTPMQTNWHLANCQHGGASFAEVQAVRKIAIEVASKCGTVRKNDIPEVTEM